MGLGHCLLTHRLWTLHGEYSSLRQLIRLHKLTSDSTNQTAHDISTNQSVHDVTDNSANQNAHDITGESTNKRTEGETVPTEPTNQNTGNVDFHVTNKGFHWNVDATEFIPSFL